MTTNNRLAQITARQRSSRLKDVFFAACVALAAGTAVTCVSTAAHAATPTHISQR